MPDDQMRPVETAPRDGSEYLARCVERGPFSHAPSYSWDIARWSGKTPADRIGHHASRSGAIVIAWAPLPKWSS